MNTKKLTITALLSSIAIIIPYIVFFKVIIPPFFTATLGAHVPMFLAMLLGPEVAVMVGIGSFIGFTLNVNLVVGLRALMHVIVGYVGAKLFTKKMSYTGISLITAPLHGLLEVLVVLIAVPFTGNNDGVLSIFITVGVGTMIHHMIDAFISYLLAKPLQASKLVTFTNPLKY